LLGELALPLDGTLEDIDDAAKTLATGEGLAIVEMAAVSMRRRPYTAPLAPWTLAMLRSPTPTRCLHLLARSVTDRGEAVAVAWGTGENDGL
jgi:hypothetical protein